MKYIMLTLLLMGCNKTIDNSVTIEKKCPILVRWNAGSDMCKNIRTHYGSAVAFNCKDADEYGCSSYILNKNGNYICFR